MPNDRLVRSWATCAQCRHNRIAHAGTLDGSCGHLTWRQAQRPGHRHNVEPIRCTCPGFTIKEGQT